jgi:hypothetical protein
MFIGYGYGWLPVTLHLPLTRARVEPIVDVTRNHP